MEKAEERERHQVLVAKRKKTTKSMSPIRKPLSASPQRKDLLYNVNRVESTVGKTANAMTLPAKESLQYSRKLLPIAQALELIPASSRRPQLLPSAELIHIVEEIYLLRKRREELQMREMVVEYFRGRFRGKKGREKAENFLHTLTVGKAQAWEVKGFLKILYGEWPEDVLYLYETALLRLESFTQSKLSISIFHTEYLGDSHSLSPSSLYLTPKDAFSLLSSVCSRCGRISRSRGRSTDTPASQLLYELLASHLAHV